VQVTIEVGGVVQHEVVRCRMLAKKRVGVVRSTGAVTGQVAGE